MATKRQQPDHDYPPTDAEGTWDSTYNTPPRDIPHVASGGGKGKGRDDKQSKVLIDLALQRARVFTGTDGVFYLAEHERGIECYPIRSARTRRWLNRIFRARMNRPPTTTAIGEVIDSLESVAEQQEQRYPVHIRFAGLKDRVLLDMTDIKNRVIEITSQGWRILPATYWHEHAPVIFFLRPERALPLPEPDRDGTLDDVHALLQAVPAEDRPLVDAYLMHLFQPSGDYWVLVFSGEQGSLKSFTGERIRMLVDPNTSPSSGAPRDEDALTTYAKNCPMVVFDNLSSIPEWLSDALCRLSTGSGLIKRRLFTDLDATTWYGQRPTVLGAISNVVRAGDLLDRTLIIALPKREDLSYISKDDLLERFHEQHPRALGGLLNALVGTLGALPKVRREFAGKLPRMTDATLYGLALERSQMKRKPAQSPFLAAYLANRQSSMTLQLEGMRMVKYLRKVIEKHQKGAEFRREPETAWVGTASALLDKLDDYLNYHEEQDLARTIRHDSSWPKSPNHLSTLLARNAAALRKAGFTIEHSRPVRGKAWIYRLEYIEQRDKEGQA